MKRNAISDRLGNRSIETNVPTASKSLRPNLWVTPPDAPNAKQKADYEIEDHGFAGFDIRRANRYPDLSGVEPIEVNERLDSLAHRAEIVKTAEHERIHRRHAWMKVPSAANEPGAQRADPAIQMPPGDGSIILRWRKIPEGAKPLYSLFAAIAGDQGCRNCSGGGAGDPVQRRGSSRERLIGAGVVSGQSEAAGKNHGDCSGRFFHRSSGSPAAMFDGRPGQGSMMQTLRPVFSFRQSTPRKARRFPR